MSTGSKSDGDSYGVDDLLEIKTRCRELRKEKDMVKESQSQGFELIRRLDLHVKTLSDSRSEDKIHIQELERELRNCSQEIDYLQDQLNARDMEVIYLREHMHSFVPKLEEMENLQEEVGRLRDDLMRSDSEQMFLLEELENKEVELQNSTALITKLEESLSSANLESQCEIESMKLDIMALEQSCFEAKKFREDTVQEKARMSRLIRDLEFERQDARKAIECLEDENKELREMLEEYEIKARVFCQKIRKHFKEWGEDKDGSPINFQSFFCELFSKEMSTCGEVLGPLLSKVTVVTTPDSNLNVQMEKMSHQVQEYELLVEKLKEELKAEKIKAKDEAEDLAQEMAELRYQFTNMLEEECKRRACIEQASLQRIAELEGQIQNEERKSLLALRNLGEAEVGCTKRQELWRSNV